MKEWIEILGTVPSTALMDLSRSIVRVGGRWDAKRSKRIYILTGSTFSEEYFKKGVIETSTQRTYKAQLRLNPNKLLLKNLYTKKKEEEQLIGVPIEACTTYKLIWRKSEKMTICTERHANADIWQCVVTQPIGIDIERQLSEVFFKQIDVSKTVLKSE